MFVKNEDLPNRLYMLLAGKVASPLGGSFDSFQIRLRVSMSAPGEYAAKVQNFIAKSISGKEMDETGVDWIRNISIIKRIQKFLKAESKSKVNLNLQVKDFPFETEDDEVHFLYGFLSNCPEVYTNPPLIDELISRNAPGVGNVLEYICVSDIT